MTQAVRETALRPAAAEFYPVLAGLHVDACRPPHRVGREDRGVPTVATDRDSRISEGHFRFRGGDTRASVPLPSPPL